MRPGTRASTDVIWRCTAREDEREGDGDYTLLVVKASSEAQIRARLRDDPWAGSILTNASVEPWTVWLRAPFRL